MKKYNLNYYYTNSKEELDGFCLDVEAEDNTTYAELQEYAETAFVAYMKNKGFTDDYIAGINYTLAIRGGWLND